MRKSSFISTLLYSLLVGISACSYPEKIKDGRTGFERKQFSEAIKMLPGEFAKAKTRPEKAQLAYMLAESYRRTNQPQKSAEWYGKAAENFYGKDEGLQQARMFQQLEQYDDATKAFQSAGRTAGDVNFYREQIQACKNAKIWLKRADSSGFRLKNLEWNTPFTDFGVVALADTQLIFSSDRPESTGKNKYKWTDKPFFDFYTVNPQTKTVNPWINPLNQKYHQGTPVFNRDRTVVFFTQCGSDEQTEGVDYCHIYKSELSGGTWSKPELQALTEPQANTMHPALVETPTGGQMLYFTSNSKSGYGGYDLYMSLWVAAEQKWAAPKNLGASINTKGNEVFPYMNADTLYFSSDGLAGMGGLDIFRAERQPSSANWANLKNLRAPLNSGGDDFGFIIVNSLIDAQKNQTDSVFRAGYVCSNRLGGKGSDDIYMFEQRPETLPAPPLIPTIKVDTPKVAEKKFKILLKGLVKEQVRQNPNNPNSPITGTANLVGSSVQIMTADTAFTIGTETEGDFALTLTAGTIYALKASKEGYFTNEVSISTQSIVVDSLQQDTLLLTEIILDKTFTGQEITLENIYYDYDKSDIRADAQPTLNALAQILTKNPQIRIQLGSHTDCRGKDAYNLTLSQQRAESAVKYLSAQNINPARLVAKGFGETRPAETCKCETCTEDQHQKNRRTTFMVLE